MPEVVPISEAEPWWRVGIAPDEARQPVDPHAGRAGLNDDYRLIVVEFDDQGTGYQPEQMAALQSALDGLQGQNAIVLVFVHGWKHNARHLDPNLASFKLVLQQTARAEHAVRAENRRPVLGVFVGWRGLSFYWGWLTNLTFWNRKTAALRVALGSVRELFGRLRYHRRANPDSVLIVVGHSFGGLVVFSALAQSLIEIATFDTATSTEPSFANLVLLVNPAFEAARYLPIHLLVDGRQFQRQPPVLVSVTARNDDATGKAFPVGAWLGSRWEHTRSRMQAEALVRTMGHLDWMRTHDLTAQGKGLPKSFDVELGSAARATDEELSAERKPSDVGYAERRQGWERHFQGGAVLKHLAKDPSNPFWVVRASPEVINGHNGIFGDVFLGFVRKLVAEQLR
jgi:pimeloyl-ACP methyl ester carboxylesterase